MRAFQHSGNIVSCLLDYMCCGVSHQSMHYDQGYLCRILVLLFMITETWDKLRSNDKKYLWTQHIILETFNKQFNSFPSPLYNYQCYRLLRQEVASDCNVAPGMDTKDPIYTKRLLFPTPLFISAWGYSTQRDGHARRRPEWVLLWPLTMMWRQNWMDMIQKTSNSLSCYYLLVPDAVYTSLIHT